MYSMEQDRQASEEAVIRNLSPRDSPHPFDWIEVWRVWMKHDEFDSPRQVRVLVSLCDQPDGLLVPRGVVKDNHNLPSILWVAKDEVTQESNHGLEVEPAHLTCIQLASHWIDQAADCTRLPPCIRLHYRLLPLDCPSSGLRGFKLEMDLIVEIDIAIGRFKRYLKFFLNSSRSSSDTFPPGMVCGRCNVKPSSLMSRWHWRTPRTTP